VTERVKANGRDTKKLYFFITPEKHKQSHFTKYNEAKNLLGVWVITFLGVNQGIIK